MTYAVIIFCLITVPATIVIICAWYWQETKDGCGIPLYYWIMVEFLLTIVKVFGLFLVVCMITRCIRKVAHFAMAYFLLISLLQVAWLIYGYTLYFSDDNDCAQKEDSYGWLIFFIILLFIGLFFILSVLILLIVACCKRKEIFRGLEDAGTQQGGQEVGAIVSVVLINPEAFETSSCAKCIGVFTEPRELRMVKLECGHSYHEACLQQHAGEPPKCPSCSKPFDKSLLTTSKAE